MPRGDFDFESRLVPLLLWFGRERGLDVAPWVERYHLPADAVGQPPGKVSLTTPASVPPALAQALAGALNDPHVGLALAAAVPRGAYGVAEFLVRTGPTLRQAFEHLARFNGLIAPSQTFRFEEGDGEGRLHHACTHTPGALGRHLNEYTSAILARALFSLADVKPLRAWFTHGRPPDVDVARLTQALGTAEVSYDAPTNGWAIAQAELERPVVGADPALAAFLEEHAAVALASRPRQDDFIDKLRHLVREALQQGEPNVERVAARLQLSGRTLQRRLGELQTTFQEVLDQVRFDLARTYLKDPRLDVSQVAYLLGYSELRAFDRAFRRWAEQSPGEWRRQA